MFYDMRNKVVFLHMLSPLDADVMINVIKSAVVDFRDKGFLQTWTDLQLDVAKTLLFLFALSHIVVCVHPSIHFDLNYLHLFRVLDAARVKAQPYFSEVLAEVPSLPKKWAESGRPCSPRMLFVFESFNSSKVKSDRRDYELQLEDQIYRFLRKSRIITNICANSLFAICNQMDFVHIATTDCAIRDPLGYLSRLLLKSCEPDAACALDASPEDDDSFYKFLWSHINMAFTKGFDDNVGRHNVTAVFELPTTAMFVGAAVRIGGLLLDNESQSKDAKLISTQLRASLDTDTRFAESRNRKFGVSVPAQQRVELWTPK